MAYNPDDYAGQPSYVKYQAWIAAGRPTTDSLGRPLDTQGGNITFGFSVPGAHDSNWLQQHSMDQNDPNRFLYEFAHANPWAADALSAPAGGAEGVRNSLQGLTMDQYNAYDPDQRGLIRSIWDQWGFKPDWWGAGPDGGNPVGNGAGPPPSPPGWGGAVLGTPPPPATNPGQPPGNGGTAGRPKANQFQDLNMLSNNMGNTPGQTSPFRTSRPGSTFGRSGPRGYQGY